MGCDCRVLVSLVEREKSRQSTSTFEMGGINPVTVLQYMTGTVLNNM